MRSSSLHAACFAVVFAGSAAWSQNVAPPTQPAPNSATQPSATEFSLAGQIEIVRLVDLVAQRLKIAVDYDGAALKAVGPITLRAGDSLSDQELWVLVNRVLAARGFTTVRGQGASAYSIVKLIDAPGLARAETDPMTSPAPGYRTVVVRAQNRSAKELVEAVAKVVSKPGGVATALGDAGLMLISDLSSHVDQALEVHYHHLLYILSCTTQPNLFSYFSSV